MSATRSWIQTKTGDAVRYGSTRGRGGRLYSVVLLVRCGDDVGDRPQMLIGCEIPFFFLFPSFLNQSDQCLSQTVWD